LKKQKVQVLKLETALQLNVKKPQALAKWKRRAEKDFGITIIGPKAPPMSKDVPQPVAATAQAGPSTKTLVHPFLAVPRPRPPAFVNPTVEGTADFDLARACEDLISQTEITYSELRNIIVSSLGGAGLARADKELNSFERRWKDYRDRGSPSHEETPTDTAVTPVSGETAAPEVPKAPSDPEGI
jgi:hypothetical protein